MVRQISAMFVGMQASKTLGWAISTWKSKFRRIKSCSQLYFDSITQYILAV